MNAQALGIAAALLALFLTGNAQRLHAQDGESPAHAPAVHGVRCGFPQIMQQLHADMTAGGARTALGKLPAPPQRQTSMFSPSGRFRIHFDTTGFHAPAMLDTAGARVPGTAREFVDSVARAFDASWDIEVNVFGYETPPTLAGSQAYDVYIEESGGMQYGVTMPVDVIGGGAQNPMYTTYIEIDNDFREFTTTGLTAARATVAHEFHHAIQLGRYGDWMGHLYIYEMTSTAMEEAVFPDADDYIQYLEDYMQDPQQSLYAWAGYEAVLWPLRFHALYGPDPWRGVWERCRSVQPMEAMRDELLARGTSLASEFCDYTYDVYRSGYRAEGGGTVFDDAPAYPAARISKDTALGDSAEHTGTVAMLGVRFYRVIDGTDTLTLAVAGVDEDLAVQRSTQRKSFRLVVKRHSGDLTLTPLSGGWGYRLETTVPAALCVNTLDAHTTGTDPVASPRTHALAPHPQPFVPAAHGAVRIPLDGTGSGEADVTVYALDGRILRRLRTTPASSGREAAWDGRDGNGRMVPSGVYLYTVTGSSGTVIPGKLTVIGGSW